MMDPTPELVLLCVKILTLLKHTATNKRQFKFCQLPFLGQYKGRRHFFSRNIPLIKGGGGSGIPKLYVIFWLPLFWP